MSSICAVFAPVLALPLLVLIMVMWYNTDMEKGKIMEVFLEDLARTGNFSESVEKVPVESSVVRAWCDEEEWRGEFERVLVDNPGTLSTRVLKEDKKREFLRILGLTGHVREACEAVGVANGAIYSWRRDDVEFSRAWNEALARHEQDEAALILGYNGQRVVVTDRQEQLVLMRQVCLLVEETNNISEACRRLGLSRQVVDGWRAGNESFAAALREAREGKVDDLEATVYERGMDESDRAALAYLKAHRRDTWGDQVDVNVGQKVVTLVWPEQEIVEGEVRELEDIGKLEDSGDVI